MLVVKLNNLRDNSISLSMRKKLFFVRSVSFMRSFPTSVWEEFQNPVTSDGSVGRSISMALVKAEVAKINVQRWISLTGESGSTTYGFVYS